ncbi:hypothetical protein E3J84_05255 [Candidatus Aerophobetes bacterium]|uniref:Transposase IS110-like N-terminal domain-containing protein n=1 Tax=Aerophobetes bacterium TaxID=2030807 RepID=A0A523RUH8_UNCAE|nr:MAG: hypothetical protein E3J84_05255 [Candidatus Aerophobetes bacterium]
MSVCLHERGSRLGYLKFDNNLTGFTKSERLIGKLSISDNGNIILGMEATGHYWFPLYELLETKRYQVKVFNPLKVNRFRDFYIQPTIDFPQGCLCHCQHLKIWKGKTDHSSPRRIFKGSKRLSVTQDSLKMR